MASKFMTPGVTIVEKPAFPSSASAVETAIPVFIGYTEKAEWNGKPLVKKPTRITSFAEYTERFGGGFNAKFTLADPDPKVQQETFSVNGVNKIVKINDSNTSYMHSSIRLFYANGGGPCYILCLNTYGGADKVTMDQNDFINSLELLTQEAEPTLVVMPDAIALGEVCYAAIYAQVLTHCNLMQSRFAIFDLVKQAPGQTPADMAKKFRSDIGVNFLMYGAAYYPWVKSLIVTPGEVTFENLDATVDLEKTLTEENALGVVADFKKNAKTDETSKRNYHQALKATSPTYNNILEEIRSNLNELPPSAAIAGLYATIDGSRGVWKSPANVSVSSVSAPSVNISNEGQESFNVDVLAGKSINVIRSFPGIGTLVWGGRTLDGNSQDWRYINVRRTITMIEQSLKLASRAYVFEPNDANTWVTVQAMMINFLTNLWKQGALAGSTPEAAFSVQVGLGSTMTPTDILDGKMLITVKVAVVRPAEFIEITFQQQMQQS